MSVLPVVSIQSQVAFGHVGNSAAVPALQALGVTVAAVPTTLLSNHPRYPTTRGRVLEPELVADLLRGVGERGVVDGPAIILTGYLGSPANAAVVADFVEAAKARNPNLFYVCDPVMGDDDPGLFVNPALPDIFRGRLVPLSDATTPNQFELELLAGLPARSLADLGDAAATVRTGGAGRVVVTGATLRESEAGTVETVLADADGVARFPTTRLPIRPSGTGDLFAGLLAAHLARGLAFSAAVAAAVEGIFAVIRRTEADGSYELRLAPALAGLIALAPPPVG